MYTAKRKAPYYTFDYFPFCFNCKCLSEQYKLQYRFYNNFPSIHLSKIVSGMAADSAQSAVAPLAQDKWMTKVGGRIRVHQQGLVRPRGGCGPRRGTHETGTPDYPLSRVATLIFCSILCNNKPWSCTCYCGVQTLTTRQHNIIVSSAFL